MKRDLKRYYHHRASSYSDLDDAPTIVSRVRSIGMADHIRIMEPTEEDLVLDVGCGTGRFVSALAPYCRVIGVDMTQRMLEGAKGAGRPLVLSDAEGLPFKDAAFDMVHSAGLLGIYRSPEIIKECARVLKPGGRAFISFPASGSVSGAVFKVVKKATGRNPTLLDHWYTMDEVEEMFSGVLTIEKVHRLGWEPPFQRWYKKVESVKLVQLFDALEHRLRDKPLFSYFSGRYLVSAVK
jgi:ubiquinone/menaquinone biosynthesis C-methylase UbiE